MTATARESRDATFRAVLLSTEDFRAESQRLRERIKKLQDRQTSEIQSFE